MKREDAVKLLRVAFDKHEGDAVQQINLANPNHDSDGYQLQIKASKYHKIDELKVLLAKYGVTVKEENNLLIIS